MKKSCLWNIDVKKEPEMKPTIIKEKEPETQSEIDYYVISAGENRNGRKRYICFYKDCKQWSISVIPTISTLQNVEKVLKRVNLDIPKLIEKNGNRIDYKCNFEIQRVNKNFNGVLII